MTVTRKEWAVFVTKCQFNQEDFVQRATSFISSSQVYTTSRLKQYDLSLPKLLSVSCDRRSSWTSPCIYRVLSNNDLLDVLHLRFLFMRFLQALVDWGEVFNALQYETYRGCQFSRSKKAPRPSKLAYDHLRVYKVLALPRLSLAWGSLRLPS